MENKKLKIVYWELISATLFLIAIVWNIRTGGLYNLEIAVGAFILVIIKIWKNFLN